MEKNRLSHLPFALRLPVTLARLPNESKLWLALFVPGSLLVLCTIYAIPTKWWIKLFGSGTRLENRPVCMIATKAQRIKARRIGKLMSAVGRHVPWRSSCLTEALCVKWLLNRYRIPAVFYLGARIAPNHPKGMMAHAWVSVGPIIVIGGPVVHGFQYVATFTTPTLE